MTDLNPNAAPQAPFQHPYPAGQLPPEVLQSPPPKKNGKAGKIVLAVGAALVALVAFIGVGSNGSPSATQTPDQSDTAISTSKAPAKTVKPKPTPTYTKAQEQAIGSAEDYLSFAPFSRKGLIEQLSSDAGEGYPKSVAVFAVDHVDVNWNKQAAKAAKGYLKIMHFSRKGLIQQLQSSAGDGYTHSQAVYGVNKAGL